MDNKNYQKPKENNWVSTLAIMIFLTFMVAQCTRMAQKTIKTEKVKTYKQ